MNKKQRAVLLVTAVTVIVAFLFPPFRDPQYNTRMGYAFLFIPPTTAYAVGSVDIGMLLCEWVGALIVGGLALVALHDQ